jgi:hypothetical protein
MNNGHDLSAIALRLLAIVACCVGCSNTTGTAGRGAKSPPIDRLFIYVRDWPKEEAHLTFVRDKGKSTVVLVRPGSEGRRGILLDSIGPDEKDAEMIVVLLDSFDVWALNAPNAPGAACTTANGERKCIITEYDYSLVMQVESRGRTRVQRYTRLEQSSSNRSARGLGDYVLAWARERQSGR